MKDDDTEARKRRAEQLKKKIAEVTAPLDPSAPDASAQRPGESDAEYVHRRMRELERTPKRP
jgi:hypothetical protein